MVNKINRNVYKIYVFIININFNFLLENKCEIIKINSLRFMKVTGL